MADCRHKIFAFKVDNQLEACIRVYSNLMSYPPKASKIQAFSEASMPHKGNFPVLTIPIWSTLSHFQVTTSIGEFEKEKA
ncbi:hypothetical protein OUZ56_027064 [Daphnia magna]|uniref:Uncharacterized protein n=1 Tax=Daphnia magna TaxID=35525 RepID=A0ABQ9ZNN4_9CRUS|nr:hypothetical protein OUZ56_027064 [Daphnia magna]